MKEIRDMSYGDQPENKLDVYLPEGKNFKTVVDFHGGGLESGDKAMDCFARTGRALAEKGICSVSANYRMYPSAVFPDFIRDGAKAVKFVAERLKSWGGNGKIYISGHSAGAYISMMLCLDTKYLKDENLTPGDIDGWVIDSAQQTTHYNVLRERGEYTGLQRIDEAAPMFFVSPKTSFSKMLLLFYTEDIACRYEQNMLLYKAILNCNANAQIEYRVLNGQHCSDLRVETDGGDLFADILSEYVLKN